jgi:autotransporter-associated beta strand protein
MAPFGVVAQDSTWIASPPTNAFNNAANWTAGVPTGVATFGASSRTSIDTANGGAVTTVGSLSFTTVAPAYTFTVSNGDLTLNGAGITNSSSNAPTITNSSGNFINFQSSATAANAVINNVTSFLFFKNTSTAANATINNTGTVTFQDTATAGNANITTTGASRRLRFLDSSSAGNAVINSNGLIDFIGTPTAGSARIITTGGTLDASGMTTGLSIGSLEGSVAVTLGATQLTVGGLNLSATMSGTISGAGGSLVKIGSGILTLTGANTYDGGTTITGGLINFAAANNFGTGTVTLNGGGVQWAAGNTADISSVLAPLGSGGGTFDTNGNNVTFATALSGTGGLTKAGAGTLTLSGANTYSGGTTVNAGTLQLAAGASLAAGGALTINGGTFATNGNVSVGALSGTGGVINLGSGTLTTTSNSNATLASTITGAGGLTKAGSGTLSLTGANTYTGPTAVNAGTLAVNGSLTSNVTVGSGGALGGSGTIAGNVTMLGTLAPGNSIGTLNVNGNFTQSGGTYVVEANAQGQSDKVNVTGTATISGAAVQVVAAPGNYATSTTYTILSATGGRSGTYSGVTSNFAFLTPSLSYDANNVYLTLALLQNNNNASVGGFLLSAYTTNQQAVAYALNQSVAGASGDFATVIGALANLNSQAGPWALNQISGQPVADFGSFNVANNALFMNALGQQMAVARGSAAGTGQRQALAQACDDAACDGASPFSVWGSVLGGVGSVQGNGNASTFTYNVGGGAAGVDYRVDSRFLVGLGTGYTNGTQWVDSFQGKGWSNTVSVAAYGSFTPLGTLGGAYVDALAGYAYSNNQVQRQLMIPGLQPRTSSGSTGANQFLGQVETGYAVPVYAPANATAVPFARFQASSINQAAFQEWGANSLSLNVAQQTTTSLRTTLGAELDGAVGGIDLGLRLGWLHEYADTSRPITAAFAGAPTTSFTVYGATPQRDSAVIGFQASASVAAATQLYLRYDGEVGSGADNHTLNLGVRLSW